MSAPAATLRQRRCDNHPQREASARCPECGRYFCRECITEHDDRVLCASCLAKLSVKKEKDKAKWEWAPRFALALLAVAAVFFVLLLIGNLLLGIPAKFHTHGGW
jgi:late competence protein required for DNA uptake (superfamily II DNA/RNA helicase)